MDPFHEGSRGWLVWDRDLASVSTRLVGLAFVGLLGVIVLASAAGGPESLVAWQVVALYLLFSGMVIAGHSLLFPDLELERPPWVLTGQLALLVGLLAVVYQSGTPGIGLGIHRPAELAVVFLALTAFFVLAGDPRRYSAVQWLVIGCYVVVVGIFFYHSLSFGAENVRSRLPLWAGLIMGINLLVLPRYLPTETFLWAVNRVSALVVLLGLPAYLIGEYTLFGLQFRFHGAYTVPYLEYEVTAMRSLFFNRNTFGVLVLGGVVAALAEFHRAVERSRSIVPTVVLGALLAVNGAGLLLSYGRAPWVVAVLSVGVYVAYVAFGRRAVPAAAAAAVGYMVGGILLVYSGVLGIDSSGRFELWGASVAAILDQPSLLGEGLISTGDHILEYRDGGGAYSSHNSYLSVWIRAGFLGGIAYALLVGASLVWGVVRYRDVDVAVLALAMGFAAHQLFEGYSLFQWEVGSVLATLALGFLVFGEWTGRAWSSVDR